MRRTLLASTALVAFLTTAAVAQTTQQPVQPAQPETQATQPAAGTQQQPAAGAEQPAESKTTVTTTAQPPANLAFISPNPQEQMLASNWLGQEIYDSQGESIGEIDDILFDQSGRAESAVIDVGGFLGVGAREVLVPLDQVQQQTVAADQGAGGTAQQPAAGGTEQSATGMTAQQPAAGGTDQSATGTAAQQPAAGGAEQTAAAAERRLVTTLTREQVEALPEHQDPEDVAATTTAPATGTGGATGTGATMGTGAATGDQAAAPSGGTAPATGTETTAQTQAPAAGGTQTASAPADAMSADDFIGTRVFGANDEALGEIGDLVFTPEGNIQGVVVDVGGFLGIGEKPVAIGYDTLNIQREEGGELKLSVPATQDQLEGAPAFQSEQ